MFAPHARQTRPAATPASKTPTPAPVHGVRAVTAEPGASNYMPWNFARISSGSLAPSTPAASPSSALRVAAPTSPFEQQAWSMAARARPNGAPALAAMPVRVPQADGAPVGRGASRAIGRVLASPGRPLDTESRLFFEARFGHDLSTVRLHSGPAAERSARSLDARAYALGENIVLGPGAAADGHPLLAHELAHVLQHRQGAAPTDTIFRAPDKNQKGSSRSIPPGELHDILVKLLKSLKRKTQLSVMGFKTIALGLVELTDENGSAFQTLVYTASGNWGSVDLEEKAAALGITRGNPRARSEGRGAEGAPEDAEALLIEDADQADGTLLAAAVSRNPCVDCAEALADADVQAVFVDPSKHLAKRARVRKQKPSGDMVQAQSEVDQAFGPQLVAPGAEAQAGLGRQSSVWRALDKLAMPELYAVLEQAQRAGRLGFLQQKVGKAEGVFVNRLAAPMQVLELKRENLKEKPDALKQFIVNSTVQESLASLPQDQQTFLLHQLYPALKLAPPPPPKTPAPKKKEPETSQPQKPDQRQGKAAEPTSSYVGPIVKALLALGVAAAAVEGAGDALGILAAEVFKDVVLRIVAEGGLKTTLRQAIKTAVEEGVKEAGPKLRFLSKEVLEKLPEQAAEELEHSIEQATHGYLHPLGM